MINNFLDTLSKNKLTILNHLIQKNKAISISDIAKSTDLSVKTVKNIIQTLEIELNSEEINLLLNYNGKLLKDVSVIDTSIESIAQNYLSDSVMLKMILYLFLDNHIDYKFFCDNEYISPSTFYKNLNKLKKVLKECSLSLDLNLHLVGDEMVIRNFYYRLFSNVNIEILPDNDIFKQINSSFYNDYYLWKNINTINKERLCLLVYIATIRNKGKQFITNKEISTLIEEFECDGLYNALCKYFEFYFSNTPDLEIDTLIFSILKEHLLPFKKKKLSPSIDKVREEVSYIKYSDILAQVILELFPDKKDDDLFKVEIKKCTDLLHADLSYSFIDLRKFFFIYDSKSYYAKDFAEEALYTKAIEIFNKLKNDHIYKEFLDNISISEDAFCDQIYIMIYNIKYKTKRVKFDKVKIYVQNSKPHIEELIIYKLETLFHDNIEFTSTPFEDLDLLVSDLETQTDENHEIYISTFSDKENFEKLVFEVTKAILKKFDKRSL